MRERISLDDVIGLLSAVLIIIAVFFLLCFRIYCMPEDPVVSEPETEIAPTATPIPTPTPTTTIERVSLGEFKITAYCPCAKCCGKSDGITSTGAVATEGRTIAVDPRVIPYGSIVEINGAEYVAEDCGGAIKNNRVDMFFESHTAALVWGVKYYEVFILRGGKNE